MESFKETVEVPEAWFRQAWQMFEASKVNFDAFRDCNVLKTDRDMHRKNGLMDAAKLCLSLALENAFKGAYVYLSKPDLSGNKLNTKHFHKKAHDLVDLADRLELRLLDSERIFLKRLTSFIVWAARYNAPLTENVFKDFEGEHKITYPHDFDYVEKLIENLQRQSGYSEENGWPYKS